MPQLVPLYFTNEKNYAMLLFIFLVYSFSKYGLPLIVSSISIRGKMFVL